MTFSWHEHFKKIIQFLDEYKIFYNFTNTDILTQNILNRISDDWKTFYKNNGKKLSDDNLGPFQEFFQSVDTLKKMPNIESQEYTKISTDQNKLFLGLNDKKRHEIEELSKAIHNKCTVSGIKVIVDLGSGLGYVSQLLNQRYGYKVIGLESDEKRIESALKRQKKYFPDSRNQINYIHHFVTENSCNLIQSLTSDQPFVITGLHACADLTISAIKLFLNIENCKDLIIMPCCYHKMEIRDSNFINFPISKALNDVYKSDFINIPFMRLGCQRSSSGWSRENEDGSRIFHLLSRGIMEKYVKQEKCKLSKRKRRGVSKTKTKNLNFQDFLTEFVNTGYTMETISEPQQIRQFDKDRITKMWNDLNQDDFMAAEILIMVQDSLQPVCEALILEDKVAFIQESGFKCNIAKIADDKISPRCHALVANKDLT